MSTCVLNSKCYQAQSCVKIYLYYKEKVHSPHKQAIEWGQSVSKHLILPEVSSSYEQMD